MQRKDGEARDEKRVTAEQTMEYKEIRKLMNDCVDDLRGLCQFLDAAKDLEEQGLKNVKNQFKNLLTTMRALNRGHSGIQDLSDYNEKMGALKSALAAVKSISGGELILWSGFLQSKRRKESSGFVQQLKEFIEKFFSASADPVTKMIKKLDELNLKHIREGSTSPIYYVPQPRQPLWSRKEEEKVREEKQNAKAEVLDVLFQKYGPPGLRKK